VVNFTAPGIQKVLWESQGETENLSYDVYPSFFSFNTHRPASMILLHANPQGIPTPKMTHKQHISPYVTCLPISSSLRI